jgi:membrane-associated HD superfamily phosphohydrolase
VDFDVYDANDFINCIARWLYSLNLFILVLFGYCIILCYTTRFHNKINYNNVTSDGLTINTAALSACSSLYDLRFADLSIII